MKLAKSQLCEKKITEVDEQQQDQQDLKVKRKKIVNKNQFDAQQDMKENISQNFGNFHDLLDNIASGLAPFSVNNHTQEKFKNPYQFIKSTSKQASQYNYKNINKIQNSESFQKSQNNSKFHQDYNSKKFQKKQVCIKKQQNEYEVVQHNLQVQKQKFIEPDIQQIQRDELQIIRDNYFKKSVSEHVQDYINFFKEFKIQQIIKLQKEENEVKIQQKQSKIKLKSKQQIYRKLQQKGVYVKQPHQKLNKQCIKVTDDKHFLKSCKNNSCENRIFYGANQNYHKQQQSNNAFSFRILQIKSTHSPEAYQIIVLIGQIYIMKFDLLINIGISAVHQKLVFSQGSYGNIYLLSSSSDYNDLQLQYHEQHNCCGKMSDQQVYLMKQSIFSNISTIKLFTVKCFRLKQNQNFHQMFNQVLKQYSINYLLSALQIGPKLTRNFGFDILIYENCIQFCMQYCETKMIYQNGKTDIHLKQSLATMHMINLVHLDIKPDNIAYSLYFKKWVFLDFGFSQFIQENIGQKSYICYVGTYEYSCSEMKKTLTADNYVDLYYNDIYALEKSFLFMNKYEESIIDYHSSLYNNQSLSLSVSLEMHMNSFEEILLVVKLKYYLIKLNIQMAKIFFQKLLKYFKEEQQDDEKVLNQIQIKEQIKLNQTKDYNNIVYQNQHHSYLDEIIQHQQRPIKIKNTRIRSCLISSTIRNQIVRFYKNLIISSVYVDFFYEYIASILQGTSQKIQIQKRFQKNMIHFMLSTNQSTNDDNQFFKLMKLKGKFFYKAFRDQWILQQTESELLQKQDNKYIDNFDSLYALCISVNQHKTVNKNNVQKSVQNSRQQQSFDKKGQINFHKNKIIRRNKPIQQLKKKLVDKNFLYKLDTEQYFRLYYRFITFKKNNYNATLQQKLKVSEFFIDFFRIDKEKYRDLREFYIDYYIEIAKENMKQQLKKEKQQYKDNNNKTGLNQNQSVVQPILLCLRYMLTQCTFIQPSHNEKRLLFPLLCGQYFFLDQNIFTSKNNFNYFYPWYEIIVRQHRYFRNEEEKLKYYKKVAKDEQQLKIMMSESQEQNFFQFWQNIWKLSQTFKILNYRNQPVVIDQSQYSSFTQSVMFIFSDAKRLLKYLNNLTVINIFLIFINISNYLDFGIQTLTRLQKQRLTHNGLEIVKKQILKHPLIQDCTKIYLIRRITMYLYIFQQYCITIQHLCDDNSLFNKHQFNIKFASRQLQQQYLFNNLNDYEDGKLVQNIQQNSKRLFLQMMNTPYSFYQIDEFHFHMVIMLSEKLNMNDMKMVLNVVDKAINCEQVSNCYMAGERKRYWYYVVKQQNKAASLYINQVKLFSPNNFFINYEWLNDLICFSNVYLVQKSSNIQKYIQLYNKSPDKLFQYMSYDDQYLQYQQVIKYTYILIQKTQIYLKNKAQTAEYFYYWEIINVCVMYLKTEPVYNKFQILRGQITIETQKKLQHKKQFFFQSFQRCYPALNHKFQVTRGIIHQSLSHFNFPKSYTTSLEHFKTQIKFIKMFQNGRFLELVEYFVKNQCINQYNNLDKQNRLEKKRIIKILMLFVKAYFVHFILKKYNWIDEYNYPNFNSKYVIIKQDQLLKNIKKRNQRLQASQLQKKSFSAYNQTLGLLQNFLLTKYSLDLVFQYNAPTLQILIQTCFHINDQNYYFKTTRYLLALTRFLSKGQFYMHVFLFFGFFESLVQKFNGLLYQPFFKYVLKFNQRILRKQFKQFIPEQKQWKNCQWWIFMNFLLRHAEINCKLFKKILIKISKSLSFISFNIKQRIIQTFYQNCYTLVYLEKQSSQFFSIYLQRMRKKIIKDKMYVSEQKILDYLIMGKIKSIFGITPFILKKIQQPVKKQSLLDSKNMNFRRNMNQNQNNSNQSQLKQNQLKKQAESDIQQQQQQQCKFDKIIIDKYRSQKNLKNHYHSNTKNKDTNFQSEQLKKPISINSLFSSQQSSQQRLNFWRQSYILQIKMNPNYNELVKKIKIYSVKKSNDVDSINKQFYFNSKIVDKLFYKFYLYYKNVENVNIIDKYEDMIKKKKKNQISEEELKKEEELDM